MTRTTHKHPRFPRWFTFKRGSALFVWAALLARLVIPGQPAEAAIEGLKTPVFSSPATFFQQSFRRGDISRTPDLAGPQAQNLTPESGPTDPANRTYKVGDKLPDGRVAGEGPGTPSATQMGRPDVPLLEYKNQGQSALTYNPEPVYTRKYTQSLRSFQEDIKPVVEKYGMTVDEFYRFMPERAETLTVKQRARMIAIRESVPKPTPETLFEKVVSHEDIQKYLGGKYTTVQGFVNRAQDVKGVKNPFETYQSLRLDYEGTPIDPYSNRPVGVIRFKIAETKKVVIPFSEAMGGNAIEAYPFTGNGFTAAENGRIVPEFKLPRDQFGNGFQPTSAELFEVSRGGVERLRAVYDARLKRFIPVGNE